MYRFKLNWLILIAFHIYYESSAVYPKDSQGGKKQTLIDICELIENHYTTFLGWMDSLRDPTSLKNIFQPVSDLGDTYQVKTRKLISADISTDSTLRPLRIAIQKVLCDKGPTQSRVVVPVKSKLLPPLSQQSLSRPSSSQQSTTQLKSLISSKSRSPQSSRAAWGDLGSQPSDRTLPALSPRQNPDDLEAIVRPPTPDEQQQLFIPSNKPSSDEDMSEDEMNRIVEASRKRINESSPPKETARPSSARPSPKQNTPYTLPPIESRSRPPPRPLPEVSKTITDTTGMSYLRRYRQELQNAAPAIIPGRPGTVGTGNRNRTTRLNGGGSSSSSRVGGHKQRTRKHKRPAFTFRRHNTRRISFKPISEIHTRKNKMSKRTH